MPCDCVPEATEGAVEIPAAAMCPVWSSLAAGMRVVVQPSVPAMRRKDSVSFMKRVDVGFAGCFWDTLHSPRNGALE